MSIELSGPNPTSPSLTGKKRGVDGPAPKAQPEDTSDVHFLDDGTMPLNPGEQTVQFIPGQDPSNGDAKVEIGDSTGPPKFVGLGKEELMKFANDPFWVRLRWILFILFWLIWLAMLAGAVVIILYAPKCADKLIGPTSGPYYQIDVKDFSPDGKLQGINQERVDYLAALGVKSVIISQVLETDISNVAGVTNFKAVSNDFGGEEGFRTLLQRLKDKAIKVILQFVPNHSSIKHEWFENATTQETFYVTKSAAEESSWASQVSLNVSGSAWSPIPNNENVSYLHQFEDSLADLDYRNSDVTKEINSALEYWFSLGVDGFLLSKVSYLRENLDQLNDQASLKNQPSNDIVVKRLLDSTGWNLSGINGSTRDPPFGLIELTDLAPERTSTFYSEHTAVLSSALESLEPNFTALDLKKVVEETVGHTPRNPVHWRVPKGLSEAKTKALTLVAAFLRGQLVLSAGDEGGATPGGKFQQLGADTPSVKFHREVLQAVVALNQTGAGGGTSEYLVSEEKPNVFVMKRTNDHDFIVAANFGSGTAIASLESLGESKAIVLAATTNAIQKKNETIQSSTLNLQANSAVALQVQKE